MISIRQINEKKRELLDRHPKQRDAINEWSDAARRACVLERQGGDSSEYAAKAEALLERIEE